MLVTFLLTHSPCQHGGVSALLQLKITFKCCCYFFFQSLLSFLAVVSSIPFFIYYVAVLSLVNYFSCNVSCGLYTQAVGLSSSDKDEF